MRNVVCSKCFLINGKNSPASEYKKREAGGCASAFVRLTFNPTSLKRPVRHIALACAVEVAGTQRAKSIFTCGERVFARSKPFHVTPGIVVFLREHLIRMIHHEIQENKLLV